MAPVVVERIVERSLPELWAAVTDVASHKLPLTRVETDPPPMRLGWHFVGISGFGPVVLRDPMVVTRWHPPIPGAHTAGFDVRKTGGVLAGSAQISLAALGPIRTRLRWQEDISLKPRPVGWTLAPLVDWGTAWMFSRAVDAMIDGG